MEPGGVRAAEVRHDRHEGDLAPVARFGMRVEIGRPCNDRSVHPTGGPSKHPQIYSRAVPNSVQHPEGHVLTQGVHRDDEIGVLCLDAVLEAVVARQV